MRPAITARRLGKSYRIYRRPEDRLKQALWRRRRYFAEFWALRDVDFSIAPGQTVGIVGENGSGKSTLLEIIAGTLEPSLGECRVEGRVAALLELGTGFNLDFSGRENVHLAAAVAGLDREQTEERYGDIVAFAGIGEFIDQPVKTYSSGMLLRLAFAVAIAVEPAVLIIDEVLAVGDEAFQRKCFARVEALQLAGTTILFASHDATSILSLCDSVILLDHGELLLYGEPKTVVGRYQQLLFADPERRAELRREILSGAPVATAARQPSSSPPPSAARYDPGLASASRVSYAPTGAEIEDPHLATLAGQRVNVLVRGEPYLYRYRVRFDAGQTEVRFGMLVKTKAGYELGGGASSRRREGRAVAAGTCLEVEFRFRCRLLPGVYFLNAGVLGRIDDEERYLHRILDAVMFRVQGEGELAASGIVDFEVAARVEESASD